MRLVIQRVLQAEVQVNENTVGKINKGLLVFVGAGHEDSREVADKYLKKLLGLRIFEDENGKTNLSLKDVNGELLMVSQFTLYANCKKGNRPSFIEAGEPKMRDPKVWKDGDSYYMMMGSSYHDAGRVLFYTSKDGENWTYANQCRPESYGWTIECPDLFSQNDQWIFIGCPMRLTPGEKKYPDQAVWALAEFDPKTCELKLPDTHSYVDYGLDLYAPQTTLDAEGRRVMISWMRMPMAVTDSTDRPAWNGMMSSARVVEEKEGHLYFHMHPQVDAYLSAETTAEEAAESRKVFRIQTDLSEGETLNIGGYVISRSEGKIVGDRSAVLDGCDEVRTVGATPVIDGAAQLDILVNDHLIEIFVNDGQYVLSHVVYGKSKKISGKYEKVLVGK